MNVKVAASPEPDTLEASRDPALTFSVQVELASERALRQRTEADALQASQRSEHQISELSQALAAAAADVTAARQACLESEARTEARQVSQTVEQVQHMTCMNASIAPALFNASGGWRLVHSTC